MSDAEDGCQVIAFPSRRCRYSAVIDRVSESLSVFCLRPYQIATFNLGAEAVSVNESRNYCEVYQKEDIYEQHYF